LFGEIVFFWLITEEVHLRPLVVMVLGLILTQLLLSLVLSRLAGIADFKWLVKPGPYVIGVRDAGIWLFPVLDADAILLARLFNDDWDVGCSRLLTVFVLVLFALIYVYSFHWLYDDAMVFLIGDQFIGCPCIHTCAFRLDRILNRRQRLSALLEALNREVIDHVWTSL
jgi:hypothetical protein